jgi:hypothetical protein
LGIVNYNNNGIPFWKGQIVIYPPFAQPIISTRLRKIVFIFRLTKTVPVNFSLIKKVNILHGKSEEFNKVFSVVSLANNTALQTQINGILTPDLQSKFMAFADKYDPIKITFMNDLMIIEHKYNTFTYKYTNLLKKFDIDQRDIENVNTSLVDMINLLNNMMY